MTAFLYLFVIGSTVWVGVDASRLGVRRGRLPGSAFDMSVTSWVICCLFLWIIAFPCYLVARGRYQQLPAPWLGHSGSLPFGAAGYSNSPNILPGMATPATYGYAPPAPPQMSPDGQWFWNGQQWLAATWPLAPPEVPPRASTR